MLTNFKNVSPLTCPLYIPMSNNPSVDMIGIAVILDAQDTCQLLIHRSPTLQAISISSANSFILKNQTNSLTASCYKTVLLCIRGKLRKMMTYKSAFVNKNKHICWEMTHYSSEVNSCHFSSLHGILTSYKNSHTEKKLGIQGQCKVSESR